MSDTLESRELYRYPFSSFRSMYHNAGSLRELEELPDTAERQYAETILWSGTVSVHTGYEPATAAAILADEIEPNMSDELAVDACGPMDGQSDTDRLWVFTGDQFELTDDAENKLAADLQAFWTSLPATLRLRLIMFTPGFSASQFGHDYALTRHHHGAGFWDRGDDAYGPEYIRDYLTEWSQTMGEVTLDLGADLLISVDL
jgi:hypothetical protein